MALADQLRHAREQAGLSMYALSIQSGIGVATISEIESGKTTNPGILTVTTLADVLLVSLDRLLGRRGRQRGRLPATLEAEDAPSAQCP